MSELQSDVDYAIAELKELSLKDLQLRWRTVFAKTTPMNLPRHLLVYMIAYRLQVDLHGDLSKDQKRYLDIVGKTVGQDPAAEISSHADRKALKVGTLLVREHDGVQHRVTVTSEGFLWGDRTYASLSAVAKAITGTNWNGRRFFGLPMVGERS
ncbi:MAG TPA: DUF2924 domain-containing protein [Rhizomicrobium sp.]|jgi:hypothetical protein